jgi:hypothetical protein
MELPEPQQGRLLDLQATQDDPARALAVLQATDAGQEGPVQQMEVDLLVCCGTAGPSATTAGCLSGALLVWDGRLVVDAHFASSDASILAAGPVAKFSRCVVPASLECVCALARTVRDACHTRTSGACFPLCRAQALHAARGVAQAL